MTYQLAANAPSNALPTHTKGVCSNYTPWRGSQRGVDRCRPSAKAANDNRPVLARRFGAVVDSKRYDDLAPGPESSAPPMAHRE